MLSYIEYLGLPNTIAIALVVLFLGLQILGEILEFKGKAVPELMKVRKYFARKKEERETLKKIPELVAGMEEKMEKMGEKFDNFTAHYDTDNIHKRNDWIVKVNQHLDDSCGKFEGIEAKVEKNSEITTQILIELDRSAIIDFALYVSNKENPVTREQFNRVFKLYKKYEDIIEENGLTNGEVDISYNLIVEAYEWHMKNHSFIEDLHVYGN